MSARNSEQASQPHDSAGTTGSGWKNLYKIAGAAALLTVLFLPVQIIFFILFPLPDSVIGWFTLFQTSKIAGLIDLDILLVADNLLLIPILLALYVALRRTGRSAMATATVLGFVSLILFITSNPAIQMLSLSGEYAAAAADAERSVILTGAQVMLAGWQGTAFHVAYITGSIAGIIIPAVMLRSNIFSRLTAYMGILGNVIALGLYVPVAGIYISVFSVLFLWVWYILIALRFYRLGTK